MICQAKEKHFFEGGAEGGNVNSRTTATGLIGSSFLSLFEEIEDRLPLSHSSCDSASSSSHSEPVRSFTVERLCRRRAELTEAEETVRLRAEGGIAEREGPLEVRVRRNVGETGEEVDSLVPVVDRR